MTKKLARFEMRASDDFLKALDDWRRHEEDLPPRAEAIRRLVEIGIRASENELALRNMQTTAAMADEDDDLLDELHSLSEQLDDWLLKVFHGR